MKTSATVPVSILSLALALNFPHAASAIVTGPYTADANTLHLYHFDESSGGTDPGNPIIDSGVGTPYNLTDTGGFNGRNNNTTGGYGAPAATGFGNSFNALTAGDGAFHATASPVGGGAFGDPVAQSNFQAANGAFTIEALINIANLDTGSANEQTILSHDSLGIRGGVFQIIDGNLRIFNGQGGDNNAFAAIPTTGDHAFVANEWFHVAVAYNGDGGAADNTSFYWTRLDSDATEANFIGSDLIGADFNAVTQTLNIGSAARDPLRRELKGLIDEVRISDIVRESNDFLFAAVPEPATLWSTTIFSTLFALRRQRRHTSRRCVRPV